MSDESVLGAGFWITSILTFIGCWIYCIATYGFLIGVTFGWIPSLIAAVIFGMLWPLFVIVAIGIAIYIAALL